MINALPLLSVGSHQAGSGKACIMNAISMINGDTIITDMPSCAHPLLAKFAQRLNDQICTHRGASKVLCPDCTHLMWIYGAKIIGTASATFGWTKRQEAELSAKLARFAANKVAHLRNAAASAAYAYAAYASAYASAAYAYAAYAYAAYASAYASDASASAAYASASAAAASAAYAYSGSKARYELHTALVEEFYRLTGYTTERSEFTADEVALVSEKVSCS